MSSEYGRGLRESGSMPEPGVVLLGFWMNNGLRERFVTGLKESWYHGKKAGGQVYRGGEAGTRDVASARRQQNAGMGTGELGAKG